MKEKKKTKTRRTKKTFKYFKIAVNKLLMLIFQIPHSVKSTLEILLAFIGKKISMLLRIYFDTKSSVFS